MKRLILLAAFLLLTCAPAIVPTSASAVSSYSYMVYSQWGGSWHDANKTGVDDSLMCWAASASNILDWGNWDTPVFNTETKIFQDIKNHWTNGRGWQSWAWKWWLIGSPPPTNTYAHIDVPGGGNYYPTENFFSYYTSASGLGEMASMDHLMHEGYGISLAIYKGTASHAITCWGFDYTITNGVSNYTSVYVTDSDDGVTALKKMGLTYNNGWRFTSGYTGWLISGVYGLELNKTPLGNVCPTPIATSWILLGSGLALLAGVGLRNGLIN